MPLGDEYRCNSCNEELLVLDTVKKDFPASASGWPPADMLGYLLSHAFSAAIRIASIIPTRTRIALGIAAGFLFLSGLHFISAKIEPVRPVRCGNQ